LQVSLQWLNSPDGADILVAQRRDKGESRNRDGWNKTVDALQKYRKQLITKNRKECIVK
jgi:hypothetical protein